MSIRGFVLGVVLLALVGWCMVQESVGQTRARYRLAELTQREADLKARLEKLRAEEEALRSPSRLARLVRERELELVSLGTVMPERVGGSAGRRPGQVLDEAFIANAENRMVASTEPNRR